MENSIEEHRVYLTTNFTNIEVVLIHLVGAKIIETNERDEIRLQNKTKQVKINDLFEILIRKDWALVGRKCLEIFRETGNTHCANLLEGIVEEGATNSNIKVLPSKWWKEEKSLLNSHLERQDDDILLVEFLERILTEDFSEEFIIPRSVAITGIGGVGKTTAAIWYTTKYNNDYDHIVWINCDKNSLKNSFKQLAKNLRINIRRRHDTTDIARSCFSKLAICKTLVIFDNAECFAGEHGIQRLLPKHENFHSIITSRNTTWGTEAGFGKVTQLPLDVFSREQSFSILNTHLPNVLHKEHLTKLAAVLGFLPLALQIAIATLSKNSGGIEIEKYLQRITTTNEIIHSEDNFNTYTLTLDECVRISLDSVNRNKHVGSLADKLLKVFAYICPNEVPIEFFTKLLKTNDAMLAQAIDLLQSYSLITSRNSQLSIHKLVQLVVRSKAKEEGRETEALNIIIGSKIRNNLTIPALQYAASTKGLSSLTRTNTINYWLAQIDLSLLVSEDRAEEAVFWSDPSYMWTYTILGLISLQLALTNTSIQELTTFAFCETPFICVLQISVMILLLFYPVLFFVLILKAGRTRFVICALILFGAFAINVCMQIGTVCIIVEPTVYFLVLTPLGDLVYVLFVSLSYLLPRRCIIYNHAICLVHNQNFDKALETFLKAAKYPFGIFRRSEELIFLPLYKYPGGTAINLWIAHLQKKLKIDNTLAKNYLSSLNKINVRGFELRVHLELLLGIKTVYLYDVEIEFNEQSYNIDSNDVRTKLLTLIDVVFCDSQDNRVHVQSARIDVVNTSWRQQVRQIISDNSVTTSSKCSN